MALTKEERAQRVACALLYDVLEQRKPQIQAMLKKHGKEASDDPEELFYQVMQASNERGKFFDDDLLAEYDNAGYGNFVGAAALATKVGVTGLSKVIDALKNLKNKPKTDADGNKISLRERLKGIFKKDKSGKDVSADDLENDPNARVIADDSGDGGDDDPPKKKDKKTILGMSVGLFIGMCALFLIIIIVIAVVIAKARKKKLAAAKAAEKK